MGVELLCHWPYVSKVRVTFPEAPYVSLSVRPMKNFGVDVGDFPGLAGWMVRD